MMHRWGLACYTLLWLGSASAAGPLPFSVKNLNPFIQIYGLPATEPAALLPPSASATALSLDLANNSILDTAGRESITLDGESYRLALTLRHGLDADTEIGLELPLVAHSNGFMDNFIEDWHDTFGLTNAERIKTTSNTLRYHYAVDGRTLVDIDGPTEGLGDIRLYAARRLASQTDSAFSLHLGLKLPSGDAQRLLGSGAADLSVSLSHLKRRWLSPLQLSSFVNGGLVWLGEGEVLVERQKDLVGFASTGLIWNNSRLIDLKAQLDMHSRVYDSELDQLGTHTLQLTIGGSIHLDNHTRLDIGVGENLLTDTTPDFLIYLALKRGYP